MTSKNKEKRTLPLNEIVISVLESVASHLVEILAAKEAENKAQFHDSFTLATAPYFN